MNEHVTPKFLSSYSSYYPTLYTAKHHTIHYPDTTTQRWVNHARIGLWISRYLRIVAPIQKDQKRGVSAPPRKPYSLWTCPTVEHPTHRGPAPPWNTLLTLDLPLEQRSSSSRATLIVSFSSVWDICNVVFKAKIGRKVFVMPCCDRFWHNTYNFIDFLIKHLQNMLWQILT